MGKPNKIKLSIPEPCMQDWDKMTPEGYGRHCRKCSKNIIDFSLFTDKELVDFISKAKGEICGLFCNTQLERVIVSSQPANTPIFRKLLFGTALAAGVAGTAQSQTTPPYQTNTTQSPNNSIKTGKVKIVPAKDTTKKHPRKVNTPPYKTMGVAIRRPIDSKGKTDSAK